MEECTDDIEVNVLERCVHDDQGKSNPVLKVTKKAYEILLFTKLSK